MPDTDNVVIIGGAGFIGRHLKQRLEELKIDYFNPARGETLDRPLGDVVYCIGLTADFRSRPCDTIDAHVCALVDSSGNHGIDCLATDERLDIISELSPIFG